MIFCFDIDGTICTNTDGDYEHAEPFPEVIERINRLAEEGHSILLQTARGFTTGIDWRSVTEDQMARWGVTYESLTLGKPTADVYIDDKGLNFYDWFRNGLSPQFAPQIEAPENKS
jgi:hypothetical protein